MGVCICIGEGVCALGRVYIYKSPEAFGGNRETVYIYVSPATRAYIYIYRGVCCREPLLEPLPEPLPVTGLLPESHRI